MRPMGQVVARWQEERDYNLVKVGSSAHSDSLGKSLVSSDGEGEGGDQVEVTASLPQCGDLYNVTQHWYPGPR